MQVMPLSLHSAVVGLWARKATWHLSLTPWDCVTNRKRESLVRETSVSMATPKGQPVVRVQLQGMPSVGPGP